MTQKWTVENGRELVTRVSLINMMVQDEKGKLTIPVWVHLPGHRFREAFHGKFASMVVGMAGKRTQPSKRRDIEDESASMVFRLTHILNGTNGNSRSAEEQSLYLLVGFFLSCSLGVTRE